MNSCIDPFYHPDTGFPCPCGKCLNCLKRRVSGWSFRLLKQAEVSTSAFFVTLTYDTIDVPITQKGYMSLARRDIQLFMKRLRKKAGNTGIKYYLCGEYGGKFNRPHYHIILFNCDLVHLVGKAYASAVARGTIELNGKYNFECKPWRHGYISVGQVNGASVGYCLKYMSKGRVVPMHKNDDRVPEFSLMSKGLGASYLTPQMKQWHYNHFFKRIYCNLPDGKKIAMPRYYKDKIYTHDERQVIGQVMVENKIVEDSLLTYEELRTRFKLNADICERIRRKNRDDRHLTL